MLELAKQSEQNRKDIFTVTANKKGMSTAIIEKDFWVCFMLNILFHNCDYSENIVFKGGTSLSKGYNLIKRFSEDIDLILDWRILGYGLKEPWESRSNTAQDNFNHKVNEKTAEFLNNILMPNLNQIIKEMGIKDFKLSIDDEDKQTIKFIYPQLFYDEALVQEIRLEIGSLGAWTPVTYRKITPYIAEQFPHAFSETYTEIRTVEAKRTFWEKATILHSEAYRKNGASPSRYSRHYYDLYLLYNSKIKDEAFSDLDLLNKVAKFKTKFYRSNRARYDLANKNELQLLPLQSNLEALKKDYKSMKNMIFGEYIEFDEIMSGLAKMLEEIRELD